MYRIFRKSRFALVMFCMGYFTTITVNAADAVQLNARDAATVAVAPADTIKE